MMRLRVSLVATLAVLALTQVLAQPARGGQGADRSAEAEVPELIRLLELRPGMTVADVGAGSGAWSVRFSRALGPQGRVFATDLGASQVAAMRDLVTREALGNVTVIEGATDSTRLPRECCDAILVRDAYHHFTQPEAMIRSLAESLKSGGRLAIVDFPPRPKSQLPDGVPANRGGHGVPPEVVVKEVGAVLTHIQTLPSFGAQGPPAALFLTLFRK